MVSCHSRGDGEEAQAQGHKPKSQFQPEGMPGEARGVWGAAYATGVALEVPSRAPAPSRYLSVQAHLWKQGTMGEAFTTCVMPHARSASRFRAAPTEPAAGNVLPQATVGTHSKPACLWRCLKSVSQSPVLCTSVRTVATYTSSTGVEAPRGAPPQVLYQYLVRSKSIECSNRQSPCLAKHQLWAAPTNRP